YQALFTDFLFFSTDPAPTDLYPLSLHDALPISTPAFAAVDLQDGTLQAFADTILPGRPTTRTDLGNEVHPQAIAGVDSLPGAVRSEEHTSELQSRFDLVCRLLLEKKKKNTLSIP